jgi:mannitol/fructose-specific phosphotransferase system IIA component (Ntr-type)
VVVFRRSAQGIDWNSPDRLPEGLKTRFIFLTLTPLGDDDVQVQILKRISEIMMDRQTVAAISRAGTTERIVEILKKRQR